MYVRMRKDLEPPTTNQPMFQSMLASVSDLQKQVANLSEQLARSGPPSGPSRSAPPPVPMNHPPPKPQLPSASQLEDVFLDALGIQSTGATLQLVNEHMALYDYILPPSPSSKSPLSQAVLLTLLHRVSPCN